MKTVEITSLEDHLMNHHFKEITKHSIPEKKSPRTLDTSFNLNQYVNNQFYKISKHFKEKFFVQKILHSSTTLSESSSQYHLSRKHIEIKSTEKLVCNACSQELNSEICRILVMRNISGEPQFFSFHFFAPCWSLKDFSQKYHNLTLDKVVFSIPENISMSENCIEDLQNNLSFWD